MNSKNFSQKKIFTPCIAFIQLLNPNSAQNFVRRMLDALLYAKTPTVVSNLFTDILWKVNTAEKKLFLTFDDGPTPDVTSFVLSELKKYNAQATFFCIGKNVVAQSELFATLIKEGHSIGNHTYDHANGWQTDNELYFNSIHKCAEVLKQAKATDSNQLFFRPPYGKLTPKQYRQLKRQYQIVLWDVLSFDFDPKLSKEKVLQNVIDNAQCGSIIVLHDSLKAFPNLEFALPRILEHFSTKGFKFEGLDQTN